MYIYIYIYIYAYIYITYVVNIYMAYLAFFAHNDIESLFHVCLYVYICIYIYICVCVYIYTYILNFVNMYTWHTLQSLHTIISKASFMCVYMYMYMYIYIYIYIVFCKYVYMAYLAVFAHNYIESLFHLHVERWCVTLTASRRWCCFCCVKVSRYE